MAGEQNVTNGAQGDPLSTSTRMLEAGAAMLQNFAPVKSLCAHLNAFHIYATDPNRAVEANHYCAHINEDFRQCLIYDSAEANARIIGIEYMITPRLYNDLDPAERKLWHSHVFEVKSGMAVMPVPSGVPKSVWEQAEIKEMEQVITLYGKTYHFWQIDRGDKLPLGPPQLMMSFTEETKPPNWKELIKERDEKLGIDSAAKVENRKHIKEPVIHPDADNIFPK